MADFPDTSYSLIERIKDLANEASWEEFLRIYQPVVYRMVRRRGVQDADAQDVMQQVFISVSRSIDQWTAGEEKPPFRAWLTTVTRNATTKAISRQPRDRATGLTAVAEQLNAVPCSEEMTAAEFLQETQREIVRWCKEQIHDEFTETTWDIFWKTSVESVPISEIAQQTGRSTGAIYVARHRVLSRLREKVAEVSQTWDCHDSFIDGEKQ